MFRNVLMKRALIKGFIVIDYFPRIAEFAAEFNIPFVPIDTLKTQFESDPDFREVGGFAYLVRLVEDVPNIWAVKDAAGSPVAAARLIATNFPQSRFLPAERCADLIGSFAALFARCATKALPPPFAPLAALLLVWATSWRERFLVDPARVGKGSIRGNLRWPRVAGAVAVARLACGTCGACPCEQRMTLLTRGGGGWRCQPCQLHSLARRRVAWAGL